MQQPFKQPFYFVDVVSGVGFKRKLKVGVKMKPIEGHRLRNRFIAVMLPVRLKNDKLVCINGVLPRFFGYVYGALQHKDQLRAGYVSFGVQPGAAGMKFSYHIIGEKFSVFQCDHIGFSHFFVEFGY